MAREYDFTQKMANYKGKKKIIIQKNSYEFHKDITDTNLTFKARLDHSVDIASLSWNLAKNLPNERKPFLLGIN